MTLDIGSGNWTEILWQKAAGSHTYEPALQPTVLILNVWDCGGLDKTGSSRLVYSNAWSLGNGATGQVLGTGVTLIVEVGHWGVVFEFSEA